MALDTTGSYAQFLYFSSTNPSLNCPLVKCYIELIHELNFISKVMLYYALNNILCKVIYDTLSRLRGNCTFMEHSSLMPAYSVYLFPRRQNRIDITLHLNKRC